ncbi:MAG: hypothetical protein BCS36_00240 [Desulfovibrio sp. MES5]|uniref:glycosyltransferase family 2 protein n=1 Tax=Desulfovibrio sp. MES5 TaxID=1899016 RepID=UPI000B9C7D4A|nr:glycosyltransferase family 2 protein [Desulfovibrio sp. MES5]OXS29345.1 MAG: hypothetical protein BCS36_00240 [Desulfovibrio sp. MES5]
MQVAHTAFSVVIAVYNAGKVLPRLLDSLAQQTCRDFNVIIQDGASKDNSLAIAESFASRLPALHLRSEKDSGIYDAWNKALDTHKELLGEWIIFLGADDILAAPDVLKRVHEKLTDCPATLKYACGDIEFFSEDGFETRLRKAEAEKAYRFLPLGMSFAHSALFHRKCVFAVERFDSSYKIVGDYDFLIRTWDAQDAGVNLDILVTRMSTGGCSNNAANAELLKNEVDRIRRKHFPVRQVLYKIEEKLSPVKACVKSVSSKNAFMTAICARLRKWKQMFFYQR